MEEFVFNGNFECVSMRGEVVRTAAHTDTTSTTSFYILELIPQFSAHNKDPKLEHSAVCNVLPKTINGGWEVPVGPINVWLAQKT